ncbi:SCP2 sterol-binding domain-containing protein [soil metagenome]
MIHSTLVSAINHLLTQEPWARERLLAHAGKIAHLDSGLYAVRLKVAADGLLQTASPEETPNVSIRFKLAELPLILKDRERAFSYMTIEGDADFANTISQLSQNLKWEAEHDLSKFVGDIAALRLVAGAKATIRGVQSTHRKLAENVAEYFLDENPMLIRPHAIDEFSADVARMRDDVERLAKRIEKLK